MTPQGISLSVVSWSFSELEGEEARRAQGQVGSSAVPVSSDVNHVLVGQDGAAAMESQRSRLVVRMACMCGLQSGACPHGGKFIRRMEYW